MGTLLFAVLVLLVVGTVVSYPLLRHRLEAHQLAQPPEENYSERDALLEALSDLEESHRAGKVSADDYAVHKQRLQVRYIEVVEGADG